MSISRIALLSFVLLAFSFGCDTPTALHASVDRGPSVLRVTNNDAEAWANVEITINGAFRLNRSTFAAGSRAELPLRDFVDRNGVRFDPSTSRPLRVEITTRSADGKAVTGTAGAAWDN
jgi:hypothetical protein